MFLPVTPAILFAKTIKNMSCLVPSNALLLTTSTRLLPIPYSFASHIATPPCRLFLTIWNSSADEGVADV